MSGKFMLIIIIMFNSFDSRYHSLHSSIDFCLSEAKISKFVIYNHKTYVKYSQHHFACDPLGFHIKIESSTTANEGDCISC